MGLAAGGEAGGAAALAARWQRLETALLGSSEGVANFGITLRANSSRLASTACCGTVSHAFSRKLTQSTPVLSHCFSVSMSVSGSPTHMPGGISAAEPGALAWRRTCGSRPKLAYDGDA